MASVDEEVAKARAKMFGPRGEFVFQKMDEKIHRFPAGLSAITTSYPYYIVPRLVAIGPYHHGKEHLEKMEEVKKAAASYFCQIWRLEANEAYEKVRSIVGDARGKYITGETIIEGMKDDAFAAMMFHDACFLLLYMDAYNRSYGREEDYMVNPSLRRFLFSNRDSIDNDIMLLENQLPWQVVQVLIDSVKERVKKNLMMVVGKFIADMGNTFKICEYVDPAETYVWWNDEENPPPHLLALLRRHKTELTKTSDSDDGNRYLPHLDPLLRTLSTPQTEPSDSDDGRRCLPHLLALLRRHKTTSSTPQTIPTTSPMEIGIKLTASKTHAFSDMAFVKGCLLGEVSVAPLSLSDARASCLVNMAAFEVCTASRFRDDPDKTAVCSYLALLALFMTREDDVHKLRSRGILHGPQSNREMLNFFKSVTKYLPDCGSNFAEIMENIEEYKVRRYIWTTLYKWLYNNYKTIITVLSILATLIAVYQGIVSLNKKNCGNQDQKNTPSL